MIGFLAAIGALTLLISVVFMADRPLASPTAVESATATASVSASPVVYGTSVIYTIDVSGSPTTPTGGQVTFQTGYAFLCGVSNLELGTSG
jgi:hypothetical protein